MLNPAGPADAIDFSALRRVLVIKLRHHGDVLLTTPVLGALKAAQPDIEIDALVYRDTLPLLAFNPQLSMVHTIDRKWKRAGVWRQLRHELRLWRALRARHYDLVIHLTEHNRGAWLVRLLRPRWSVAPQMRHQAGFWRSSFTHLYRNAAGVPEGSPLAHRHTVEQNLDALRRLGLVIDAPPSLTLVPGPDGEREAEALLAAHGLERGQFILMQPTSRWFFKTWPVQRNAELIGALLARGETVLLSCAPDAREQAMVAAIVEAVSNTHGGRPAQLLQTPPTMNLNLLAALIGRARLFVGIDSAPMHIAAACGTPLVALFGPSSELTWGPWQVAHRVVVHEGFPCRPCGQDGCGGGKISACLTQLPVARVLAAIDAMDGTGAPDAIMLPGIGAIAQSEGHHARRA